MILDTQAGIGHRKAKIAEALDRYNHIESRISDNPIMNYPMAMVLMEDGHPDMANQKLETAIFEKDYFIGREAAEKALANLTQKS